MLAMSIPGIVSAAMYPATGDADVTESQNTGAARPRASIKENAVVLFQGASITDAGRNKEAMQATNASALGGGYAFMAGCELPYTHAGKKISVNIKGIHVNNVSQMSTSWEKDYFNL